MIAPLALWLSLPDVEWLRTSAPDRTSSMRLDAEARSLPGGGPRLPTPALAELSPLLGCAVVKAEDRYFFEHRGYLWQSLDDAARALFAGRRVAGGSTITQQLARNLFLSAERTAWRKLREVLIARRLESLGKRRILELYLGSIEWGDGVWGARAAASRWLGKPAASLDAFEAALLAGMIAAPRAQLAGKNLVRVATVQRRVLVQLFQSGLIGEDELERAGLRAALLAQGLASGRSLGEAMPPASGAGQPSPSWDDVLASGCGLTRELQMVGRR